MRYLRIAVFEKPSIVCLTSIAPSSLKVAIPTVGPQFATSETAKLIHLFDKLIALNRSFQVHNPCPPASIPEYSEGSNFSAIRTVANRISGDAPL